jgi:hypothetical protein
LLIAENPAAITYLNPLTALSSAYVRLTDSAHKPSPVRRISGLTRNGSKDGENSFLLDV